MPHSETADARHGNLFFLQPTGMLEGTRGPVKRVKKNRVLILVTVYESTFVLHYVLQYSFCGNTKLHIGKGFESGTISETASIPGAFRQRAETLANTCSHTQHC